MLNIAIIGGGAAGFFAAISAKTKMPNSNVIVFEKTNRILAKVGISGGGRCNLTNSFADISDLKQAYPHGNKLIKRLFKRFDYNDTFQWFEAHGVQLVTQPDNCVFPFSQNSQTIIDCLTHTAQQLGVDVCLQHRLTNIAKQTEGKIEVHFKDKPYRTFDRVIITTGGSLRTANLQYLENLGHKIEATIPALFTFNIAEKAFKNLMGTVVEHVLLSIPATKFHSNGALLITHWGMSGPATLKLSSYAARYLAENNNKTPVSVNWVNETNAQSVAQNITAIATENAKKQIVNTRPYNLPTRLWEYLLQRANIEKEKRWIDIGKKAMHKLIETLTNDVHQIEGKGSFRDEFVTCGGVSLKSINPNTLESKVCKGVFFAGEVLDVDAITGGFNLQAAWTTGYVAGQEVCV
ncbi:MAG: NAD(P)/FAD-dependent oxidoreductase [Prevotella pallens]|uniref:NAD(P)/FAD-dependent oxidoreductase n=1 Tax=Prevotella pallens TaxID=60133 RepID=UPI001CAF4BC4|nr:NAD(P)/FAD-dependent oxidoreductase [Prevotella pallens]MBF1443529.1 NAD(P)/FAD-dependent oxidoreductase [Prevotella pallens]